MRGVARPEHPALKENVPVTAFDTRRVKVEMEVEEEALDPLWDDLDW